MFRIKLHSIPRVSVFILALSISIQISAQLQPECGTVVSPEVESEFLQLLPELQEIENKFQSQHMARNASNFLNYVPIKAHIIRRDNGTGGLTETQLNDAIADMNAIYQNAEIEFFLCGGINYIDDTDYYNFNRTEEKALRDDNGVPNVINIYFANTVVSSTGSNLCGYAYFPSGSSTETIMMKNSCAINGSTLSHEVGHFFALSHTHGNSSQSNELVDGSNCSSSGDYICDTPADPRLSYSTVNWQCSYTGNAKDKNDDTYVPDEQNLMSYSRKECRTTFSQQQFARINAVLLTARNNLICSSFNADFEATYTNDCENSMTVDFRDNSVGATAWEWDVDADGIVDYTTQNPTHTYTDPSKYDVSLKIANNDNITIGAIQEEFVNIGVHTVSTSNFELILNTDNRPSEITWAVRDSNGNVLHSGGPYEEDSQDEITITENFNVDLSNGCFSFEIMDSDGDGLVSFNNSVGSYELRDGDGNLIVTGSDFGYSDITYMSSETLSETTFLTGDNVSIAPNPIADNLIIQTGSLKSLPEDYVIYNMTGKAIITGHIGSPEQLKINAESLEAGMYIIKMRNKHSSIALPFIKK